MVHRFRLDIDWRLCKYAKEKGVKIVINPDAHEEEGLRGTFFGVGIARKGWLESGDTLHTMFVGRNESLFETEKRMEKQAMKKRVKEIIKILSKEIPDSTIALKFTNPLELLVATILSAQCTDVKVNQVTETLFKNYRSAEDYAEAPLARLEEEIRPTGFYRNKAKSIQKCCQELVSRFEGKVPQTLDELVTLPGVGRKTANVILGNTFGVPGIVVDTHVQRVSGRIGLTKKDDPVKIEFDLMEIVPNNEWMHFSNLLVWHGRRTCVARKPLCEKCAIRKLCDYGSKLEDK